MTPKEEAMSIFSIRYDAWVESQKGQTDAYEYEKSFVEFMNTISRELLQQSVGTSSDTRKKNSSNSLRHDKYS